MGIEDQKEEREVLDSIFPEEIEDIDETSYTISIKLDITREAGDEETENPEFLLKVSYPEAYPDEAPILELLPSPSSSESRLFDIENDREQLLEALQEPIQENMGMAMIFTLYSHLKETAETLVASRQQAEKDAHTAIVLAQEAEENKKFTGTPVNRETFMKWRDEFKREMDEKERQQDEADDAEEKRRNRGREKEVKLTGRQLWERGLAGAEQEEEGEEVPIAQMQQVKV